MIEQIQREKFESDKAQNPKLWRPYGESAKDQPQQCCGQSQPDQGKSFKDLYRIQSRLLNELCGDLDAAHKQRDEARRLRDEVSKDTSRLYADLCDLVAERDQAIKARDHAIASKYLAESSERKVVAALEVAHKQRDQARQDEERRCSDVRILVSERNEAKAAYDQLILNSNEYVISTQADVSKLQEKLKAAIERRDLLEAADSWSSAQLKTMSDRLAHLERENETLRSSIAEAAKMMTHGAALIAPGQGLCSSLRAHEHDKAVLFIGGPLSGWRYSVRQALPDRLNFTTVHHVNRPIEKLCDFDPKIDPIESVERQAWRTTYHLTEIRVSDTSLFFYTFCRPYSVADVLVHLFAGVSASTQPVPAMVANQLHTVMHEIIRECFAAQRANRAARRFDLHVKACK